MKKSTTNSFIWFISRLSMLVTIGVLCAIYGLSGWTGLITVLMLFPLLYLESKGL